MRYESIFEKEARTIGYAEGRADGKAEGEAVGEANIIAKLLDRMSPEEISALIGYSVDKIASVKKPSGSSGTDVHRMSF